MDFIVASIAGSAHCPLGIGTGTAAFARHSPSDRHLGTQPCCFSRRPARRASGCGRGSAGRRCSGLRPRRHRVRPVSAQLDQRRIPARIARFRRRSAGLLLMEAGRRLDLRWLIGNHRSLRATAADVAPFVAVLLLPGASSVSARQLEPPPRPVVTMASAPAVVLLTVEESLQPGASHGAHPAHGHRHGGVCSLTQDRHCPRRTERRLGQCRHSPALGCGHGATAIVDHFALCARADDSPAALSLSLCARRDGTACGWDCTMMAVPVFSHAVHHGCLAGAERPAPDAGLIMAPAQAHWLLAIILFVIVGASLPWWESHGFALQVIGLLDCARRGQTGSPFISR